MKFLLTLSFLFVLAFSKPLVFVSIEPQKYLVEKIANDTVEIKVLISEDLDAHSIDFKPATMKQLAKSDLYFMLGLEFEKPMLYKFKKLLKNLELVDTREGIKPLYTTASDLYEAHSHEGHSHNPPAVFKKDQVKDRALSDYEGEFKSVYPLLKNGSLDEVFYYKALNTDKSAKELKDYYELGYKSDIDKIIIKDGTMSFIIGKEKFSANYAYKGFEYFTYKSGKNGVRYQFENTDKNSKAFKFIQFSDHNIAPTKTSHFHLFFGNEGFEKLNEEMINWPTFYLSSIKKAEIIEDLIAHSELGNDPHIWLDPILLKAQANTVAKALIAKYPQNKDLYETNLATLQNELDTLHKELTNILKKAKSKKFISTHLAYFAARYKLIQVPVEIEAKRLRARDIKNLSEFARKEKAQTIFVGTDFDQNIAKLLATEFKIMQLDYLSGDYANTLREIARKIAK
ncbi:metal ABC transporter solute-binding protein, Zn/Mn family [Campylobacter troglodytis]|uniref:metal ABC transporter solute-binding protein, Zn/Mn family n=1 Tax=Campylobacter troglodytis TaxID=654363 RepID=UPI00115A93C6|nr:ZinT/AdcA family metal-binding protein [Campylobacter troglodytis]TQR60653.1 hypothetical protein DMC01_04815 [Campylobacter troglodytis]